MTKIHILINVSYEIASRSIYDISACREIVGMVKDPFWYYVSEILYVGDQPPHSILVKAHQMAVRAFEKKLSSMTDQDWQAFSKENFQEDFTRWAKGISDDEVIEFFIQSLQKKENWAWEVMRKRYIIPRIIRKVSERNRDDLVQEALIRIVKVMKKWHDFPSKKIVFIV